MPHSGQAGLKNDPLAIPRHCLSRVVSELPTNDLSVIAFIAGCSNKTVNAVQTAFQPPFDNCASDDAQRQYAYQYI